MEDKRLQEFIWVHDKIEILQVQMVAQNKVEVDLESALRAITKVKILANRLLASLITTKTLTLMIEEIKHISHHQIIDLSTLTTDPVEILIICMIIKCLDSLTLHRIIMENRTEITIMATKALLFLQGIP